MLKPEQVIEYLKNFSLEEKKKPDLFSSATVTSEVDYLRVDEKKIPRIINEFWTSKQRKASSLHEISYRACFKPQLPRFFIDLLTAPGDTVYDPFSGRGTTVIEAGLMERCIISNDINPLSKILIHPRFVLPPMEEVKKRLEKIPVNYDFKADRDLSMFYHSKTEAEIVSLQRYLEERKKSDKEDDVDRWIRMVSTNRLTGHSSGFFSVYTLPPNQAVLPERQKKINEKRNQKPEYRDTKKLIWKKTGSLWKKLTPGEITNIQKSGENAMFFEKDARETLDEIPAETVQLTVTSPPFLNVVQYSVDNWLRCWFNGIDAKEIEKEITMSGSLKEWSRVMGGVFKELFRITKPGGWVAFEVGEVRKGKINLEEHVVPLGFAAGFSCTGILINSQAFTKTANIWGINNNTSGTNSNRIVLFHKSP